MSGLLTTLDRAKPLMGIPTDDTSQDAELSLLIPVASAAIEAHCRRKFGRSDYVETVDRVEGGYLLLRNYPINSVTQVLLNGADEVVDFETNSDIGSLFRKQGWPRTERTIKVNYSAGYVLPGGAGPSDLPPQLEFACVLFIKHLQREPGVQSERVGDISVAYSAGEAEMPAAVKALIAPFIRPDM